LKTYAEPEPDPLSSSPCDPMSAYSPSMETEPPNRSRAAPSEAVSFASSAHVVPLRLKTYAEPLSNPLLPSSPSAPIRAYSPSMETEALKKSLDAPSEAVSFASSAHVVPLRLKTYAEPDCDPSSSSRYAPIMA